VAKPAVLRSGVEVRPAAAQRYPYTGAALALALTVFLAAVIWNVNVFRLPALDLIGIENSEAGEVCIAVSAHHPCLLR